MIETRVSQTKTRLKNYKKNRRKAIVRNTYKVIKFIIVTMILKTIYVVLKTINNVVSYLFNKLPRLLKISVCYILVGLAIFGSLNLTSAKTIETIVQEKVLVVPFEETKETETIETQKQVHFSNENETKIYNKSLDKGLTHEQALLLVAISKHETGNWTSVAFNEKHNYGGIMCKDGIRYYNSYEEGLNHFIELLKNNYFGQGLNTIEEIGAKYCPVGASNDPNNLNQYWVPKVTQFYNQYLESVK